MKTLIILAPIATIISVLYMFWKDMFKKNKNDNNKMDNTQNISGNNNISNQGNGPLIVDNSQNVYNSGDTAKYKIYETKRVPFTLLKKHVKTYWLGLAAFLSVFSVLLNIYLTFKYFYNNRFIFLSTFFVFMFFFSLATIFRSNKFLSIRKLKIANHNGKLYHVDYTGTCPHCNGKLVVKQRTIDGKLFNVIECQIYPDIHYCTFSPKIFDNENYHYQTNDSIA
jgi:hypothetical protein